MTRQGASPTPVPRTAGIGLRAPHIAEVLATGPAVGWFEVHPENYLGFGPATARLLEIRRDYPVSLHGVGLSLGSAEGIDAAHLARLTSLAAAVEPCLFSEHLSWSVADGTYLNDLLPLPYTEETLAIVCRNVEIAQEALGRPILVENPSLYLRFRHSVIPEPEFLAELVRRSGCGLLCDVNNIYVTAANFGLDPLDWLDTLPPQAIGEIHLAGHSCGERFGRTLLIDDHGAAVAEPVWDLYRHALGRFPDALTLIEWDRNLPDLGVLLDEARHADALAS